MITLRNITLRRGTTVLIQQANWTIYHKQRIGLIGVNGSGKTSLFSLLLQTLHADSGDLELPRQLRLAHVAQEMLATAQSALDFVLDGDTELRDLESALHQAEEKHDGVQIASIHEKLSIIDAYSARSRACQLLAGLGFSEADQERSVASFSGGWRVRLNLAQALMCRSDMLLLDEPTNHLDLDAVLWLESWLIKYPGTLLIISHDRDFLDHVVDHIAHLSQQQIKLYTGNYASFEKQRAADLMMQQAAYEKQQKQIAHMQSFVDRFRYKATKARQAQSRLKALERMEFICAVQSESPFQFEFKEPVSLPNPLITLHKATVSYGEKSVLRDLTMSITPKHRIGILGPNGAGKSSFIKLLAGEIEPTSGLRETSAGLKIGYFAQHQIDHLHLSETPLQHMQTLAKNVSDVDLRKYLGSFGFSGDNVLQPVSQFSGGEKSRLALALLVWQKPNILLLDEPTNHLDLEMRNALSIALQDYTGAMIIVSHDRFLVRSTTDELWLIAEGACQPFDGDMEDYHQWLLNYRKQQTIGISTKEIKTELSRKDQRKEDAKLREVRRPLLQKIKKLENEMLALEKTADKLQDMLADQALYEAHNKDKLRECLLKQSENKKALQQVEDAWLIACEERDC